MQYVKIKNAIVEQIESGLLLPKQKLPSERQLAESFHTTRVTLREALSLLESEGKIYREDRRGWFISPKPLYYDPRQGLNFNALAQAHQQTPKTLVLSNKIVLANQYAASKLKLAPFSQVYQIQRVRYLDNRPVAFMTNYAAPDQFPDLFDHDLSLSLSEIYKQYYAQPYHALEYMVQTSSLSEQAAKVLRTTSGSAATRIERTHKNAQDHLIDCDLTYWRHDAICVSSNIQIKTSL